MTYLILVLPVMILHIIYTLVWFAGRRSSITSREKLGSYLQEAAVRTLVCLIPLLNMIVVLCMIHELWVSGIRQKLFPNLKD